MAFRLPHGLQDALRYALRSQNTGGSRVGPNGFDHRGAFADALCVLCNCFTCDSNQHEQQQFLHHHVASGTSTQRKGVQRKSLLEPYIFSSLA